MIFLLLHLLITTTGSGGSPAYTPPDHILHNCGGASEPDSNGRSWTSDAYYPECLPPNEPDKSVTFKAKAAAAAAGSASVLDVPYRSVHIFVNQCTRSYTVSPGPKFIRLHFSPTIHYFVYGFSQQPEDSFFSVSANEHTLLANFSAFRTADLVDVVVKEYIVNVDANRLNITFTPSPNSFAFVNGIEIVSIPTGYYIRGEGDNEIKWVRGNDNYYYIFNNTALETLYRLNVGGETISAVDDSGMDRTWNSDDDFVIGSGYFTPSLDVKINYTALSPAYSAPEIVYTSSRTIGNRSNVVNWTFPVDSGFSYLFRLYFCEFQIEIDGGNERVFSVDIANTTAEHRVDVFLMAGGSRIPIFRDYLVAVPEMGGRRSKQNVSMAIRPNMETKPVWANALLNGLEIFKLNGTQGSMAVMPHHEPPGKNAAPVGAIVGGVAGGVAVVVIVILVFLVNFRRRLTRDSATNVTSSSSSKTLEFSGQSELCRHFSLDELKSATNVTSSSSSKTLEFAGQSELCRHFSLDELKLATGDFDESYVIGKGGFGKVYRASINESDGANTSIVAVKRLNQAESRQGENEFWMEINMLSNLRNQNLVPLNGYCNEEQEMLLVYEYMAGGTLASHLYKIDDDNPSLSWEQRLNICLGAARGLQYLHAANVIHRDVKSSNILLDEALVAKISDFGLSKIGPGNDSFTHISTDVKGTFGYLDPEYFLTRRLTTKSDVFAFGVVLFEVLSGRPALDMRLVVEQHSLATWAVECMRKGEIDKMFERCLVGQMSPACWKVFVGIAGRCLLREPRQRPHMADVVKNLELALALQQRAARNYWL